MAIKVDEWWITNGTWILINRNVKELGGIEGIFNLCCRGQLYREN